MSTSGDDETPAIVVDNGSGMCKAGFAGDEGPTSVFSAIIGRPLNEVTENSVVKEYIGNEAQDRRDILSLSYPIERGIVKDWDDMEKLWHHMFDRELNVSTEEHPVLMSDAALNPKANREKMIQVLFESFNVPAFYVTIQAILAVYCSGRSNALVLDIGDGATHVLPIWQGYTIQNAIKRMEIGGRDLTIFLSKMLQERGYSFSTSAELEIVREMKERLCYCSQDFQQEMTMAERTSEYILPDGQVVDIGKERFRCPEALFQPSLIGLKEGGFHELLYNSVKSMERDLQCDFYCNFVLSGGSTMFPGLGERLTRELKSIVPSPYVMRTRVNVYPERKYAVWIGGSPLASLSTFQQMWVSKQEYEEEGPSIVNRRCF